MTERLRSRLRALGWRPRQRASATWKLLTLVGAGAHPLLAQPTTRLAISTDPPVRWTAEHLLQTFGIHQVGAGVIIREGRLALADAHGSTIVIVGLDGQVLSRVGRAGDGPGEFRHIAWLKRCETVGFAAWDRMRKALVRFDSEGKHLGDLRFGSLNSDVPVPETLSCSDQGVFAGQSVPQKLMPIQGASEGILRGESDFIIQDAKGSVLGRVSSVPTSEFVVLMGGAAPRPLGRTTLVALTRDALLLFTGDSDTLGVFGLDGSRRGAITIGKPLMVPTAAHARAAVHSLMRSVPPAVAPRLESALLALPLPSVIPALSGIHVDALDRIWLQHSPTGSDITDLSVLDRSGRELGRFTIDGAFTVLDANEHTLLGTVQGSRGEESIALYRLR